MKVKNLAWNENLSKRCNHPLLPQNGLYVNLDVVNYITNKPITTSWVA